MKKAIAVAAIIGLGLSVTWAANRMTVWLDFLQQESVEAQDESAERSRQPTGGVRTTEDGDGSPSAADPRDLPELSVEVASIEEDLARIEEALENEEVLEEFIPSEPLSADNPIPMPTDI
ncbi:hypothetical protein [Candidatus Foliamicus sp.]